MNKRKQVFELTLTAVFGAIILFLTLVPNIGFIQILPGVAITIIHIPVILGALFLSLKNTLILGALFGLGSLIVAATRAATPFDSAFIYPWISILPRMLFAFVTVYVIRVFKKISFLKYGKHILFGMISLITIFSLYFGVNKVIENMIYNETNIALNAYEEAKNDSNISSDEIEELKDKYILLKEDADTNFTNSKKISTPVLIVLSVVLVIVYYFYIIRKNSDKVFVPTIFILGTLIHTFLVVLTVAVFSPAAFKETFGSSQSLISLIYLITMANGLVEALFATIIGTPIAIASLNSLEKEE